MIERFADRFVRAEAQTKAKLKEWQPESITDLALMMLEAVAGEDEDEDDNYFRPLPDPQRLTVIDHGDYQGTLVFVVGATGYQPATYWGFSVGYGSCSVCDTFQRIRDQSSYGDDGNELGPTEAQVNDYYTMMLHMVQSMRVLCGSDEEGG
jgi:hypothetical protein